jgi:hypothetical protein
MSEDLFRWAVAGGVFIAAFSLVVQAAVIFVLYQSIRKLQLKVNSLIDHADPIILSVRSMVDDLKPKISSVTSDAVDIVKIGKEQAGRVGELVQDFSQRAKIQVARIDSAVDDTVDQVQSATLATKEVLMKPVRELDGIFSGIRAALSVYARPGRSSVDHATQDEEMFI